MQNEGGNPPCRSVFLDTKVISRGLTFRSVRQVSIPCPKQVGTNTVTWGFLFCPPCLWMFWEGCQRHASTVHHSIVQMLLNPYYLHKWKQYIDIWARLHLCSAHFHFSPCFLLLSLKFSLAPVLYISHHTCLWDLSPKLRLHQSVFEVSCFPTSKEIVLSTEVTTILLYIVKWCNIAAPWQQEPCWSGRMDGQPC